MTAPSALDRRPRRSARKLSQERVRFILEQLYSEYHHPRFLDTDPLGIVRAYDDPADREVTALIAALFAFGNATSIRASVQKLLAPLGPSPARLLAEREPADWSGACRGFRHRWVEASDARLLLAALGETLRAHGSLGAAWRSLDDPAEPTILPALARWVDAMTDVRTHPLRPRRRVLRRASGDESTLPTGICMLMSSPAAKSGCKRLNMFLRWVCRRDDGVDLGLWHVDPARLIMPVDTHVLQAAHLLALTKRPTADLRAAVEITDALRAIDPADPTRYDFSLVRPGIMRLRGLVKVAIDRS